MVNGFSIKQPNAQAIANTHALILLVCLCSVPCSSNYQFVLTIAAMLFKYITDFSLHIRDGVNNWTIRIIMEVTLEYLFFQIYHKIHRFVHFGMPVDKYINYFIRNKLKFSTINVNCIHKAVLIGQSNISIYILMNNINSPSILRFGSVFGSFECWDNNWFAVSLKYIKYQDNITMKSVWKKWSSYMCHTLSDSKHPNWARSWMLHNEGEFLLTRFVSNRCFYCLWALYQLCH